MRRSPRLPRPAFRVSGVAGEEALPVLPSHGGWTWYLRGLSTGDFAEALPVLLGPDAAGLSPTTITRLTQVWQDEYQAWRKRSLAGTDYVYIWADGVYFNVRLEEDRLACLAVMGGRADGTKEIIALEDGYRESQESWASLLRDLRRRGMPAPVLAVGDGALGFWAARVAGCVSRDARATLLGSYTCPGGQCQGDCERARQVGQAAAAAREGRVARDHPGTAPGQVCAHRTGRVRKRKVSTSWKSTKRAIPKQRSAS